MKKIMKAFTFLGSLPFFLIVTILSILIDYSLPIKLLFLLMLGYLIVIPLRLIFFRERPEKKHYETLWQKIKASSFPSMHTVRSTLYCNTLFIYYQNVLFLPIFLIIISLVGYSRIYRKRHHIEDVAAGFIIGILVSIVPLII